MARIRIVTDSASDLPPALLTDREITAVPLDVRLGVASPDELRDLTPEEFWQRASQSQSLAETSAPSPGAFQQAFLSAKRDGYDGVCCVTISSSLSATYQSACAGAAEVKNDIAVRVIDSRFATLGEGLLVLEATDTAASGKELDEVCRAVEHAIPRTATFGTLDTLEYLRRGGRIGSAQAFVGSLLSIKPIVEVRDGVVEGESRQRTRSRSLRYLADKLVEAGPLQRLAVVHAAATDLSVFLDMIKDVHCEQEKIVTFIGPVIGAHTGPGTVGICFQRQTG